jgi:hypothetical protein
MNDRSCVNTEGESFKRKLGKIMKNCQYVTVMKTDSNSECFSRHGLCMNIVGKEVSAQQTAANSITLFPGKNEDLISLLQ